MLLELSDKSSVADVCSYRLWASKKEEQILNLPLSNAEKIEALKSLLKTVDQQLMLYKRRGDERGMQLMIAINRLEYSINTLGVDITIK